MELQQERLDKIIRHINHVKDNCILLGEKLIKNGEEDFGRKLIANGYIHDNSKFHGIEWLYLHADVKESDKEKFELAVQVHLNQNEHHAEFWDGIENMPRIYLAELSCDVKARSEEFGTSVEEWIKNKATKKYKFSKNGRVYKEIKEFMDLLLESSFK